MDAHRLTQVGRALRELGIQMIPAYSPQARGRSERNFGTWQGRLPQELRLHGIVNVEEANRFLREHYIEEFNRSFQVRAAERGTAFLPRRSQNLDLVFSLQFERAVNRDNTVSFQHLRLQIEAVRWRATLAGCTVRVHQHLDGLLRSPTDRSAWGITARKESCCYRTRPCHGLWKRRGLEKSQNRLSHPLGNPAQCAGFPLSHNLGYGWLI